LLKHIWFNPTGSKETFESLCGNIYPKEVLADLGERDSRDKCCNTCFERHRRMEYNFIVHNQYGWHEVK
jgi:hypothetical protein